MNIKSLLLGSAAALAVVSGAQAADAVVAAEPEPMEYVKVCDAYGSGYFYIPGTETCLKIGGSVRFEYSYSKTSADKKATPALPSITKHGLSSRGDASFTAKNDSEWGTVSSWVRLRGSNDDNGDDGFSAAYKMSVGGLEWGSHDSQFAAFGGYGGRTDGGGKYIDWDMGTRQYVSYTLEMDSISAIISLENDQKRNRGKYVLDKDGKRVVEAGKLVETGDGKNSNYVPDVVGGVKANFGDWSATIVSAYDESDNSVAAAGFLRGDIGMFGVTAAAFFSNSDANSYWNYDGFSGLLGASAKVTDSIKIAADVQYWDNSNVGVTGDVSWEVANGFQVLLEGNYMSVNKGPDTRSAFLRFERSF